MSHPYISPLLPHPMKKWHKAWSSQGHHQKEANKAGRKTPMALNSRCFHLQNSMFFLFGSSSVSDGSEILLWHPRKIYDWVRTDFTWQRVRTRFALSEQAQLLFILQMLILDSVNHCTFLLLGEELHSWNHSQENNPSLPDHPEL